MKKLFLNTIGFSMVEALISLGLIGGVALSSMKLAQFSSEGSRNLELSRELVKFHTGLQTKLNSELFCGANFVGKPTTGTYQNLVNEANQVAYAVNGTYVNGTVQIASMSTVPNAGGVDFVIEYRKLIKGAQGTVISKRIPLLVNLNGAGTQVQECFDLTGSLQDTVNYLFARRLCRMTYEDDVDFNKFFDPVARTCHLPGSEDIQCPVGQTIVRIQYDETFKSWKPVCDYPLYPKSCPGGWIKKAKSNGTFECNSIGSYIDLTTLDFTAPSNCGLAIVAGKIKLNCGTTPPPPPPVDCSIYATPLDENQGCVNNVVYGSWSNVSADCQCRPMTGDFYFNCNTLDGSRSGVECQPR